MSKDPLTIVLTGGGSGGHVTPILSLAHELKSLGDVRLIYIGNKGDAYKLSADLDVVEHIRGGKFRRYHGESFISHLFDIKTLLLNVRDFFRVIIATFKARQILKKYAPDVVFSKGSFVAVPVGLAARTLNIPIVTHDSDSVPGLANRIIGRWATVCATGMPAGDYPYPANKIRYTGVPISNEFKPLSSEQQLRLKHELEVKNGKLLLVTGGGNGSRTLNELLLAAASKLLKEHKDLHIINLAGEPHAASVAEHYKQLPGADRVKVLGYTGDSYKLINAADVIVSRAGATSISEFAAAAKACIIIPSPFLAGGHQLKNAQQLADHDAAVILPNDVTDSQFTKEVSRLLDQDTRRNQLASNLHQLATPDSTQQIAKLIVEVALGRGRARGR